jgi:hypothetical protein
VQDILGRDGLIATLWDYPGNECHHDRGAPHRQDKHHSQDAR